MLDFIEQPKVLDLCNFEESLPLSQIHYEEVYSVILKAIVFIKFKFIFFLIIFLAFLNNNFK